MSLSCCYSTSVHVLCRFSTLSMYLLDPCRFRIASSIVSLIVSRQCALCIMDASKVLELHHSRSEDEGWRGCVATTVKGIINLAAVDIPLGQYWSWNVWRKNPTRRKNSSFLSGSVAMVYELFWDFEACFIFLFKCSYVVCLEETVVKLGQLLCLKNVLIKKSI
jgi:hypothetical protein